MKLGRRKIGPGQPTFILAEAGTNHLGDVHKAIEHVKVAQLAGCDGIKFQLFTKGSELFCPVDGDERRRQRWDLSAMSRHNWLDVRDNAYASGLAFVVSVFQADAINLANELELDATKVASRANHNFPYEKCKGPFILSLPLGAPGIPVDGLIKHPPADSLWLQCCPKYPSPLKESLWTGRYPGLSDHSSTPWPAIDACLRGAALVEVHFALDPADAGPDAPVCLTPDQLALICEARDAASTMQAD